MNPFPAKALYRLGERVARGEVVFFIGAGFSLDSEGNSAPCFIRRLLARFLAMTVVLGQADLRTSLYKTFQLKGDPLDTTTLATEENIQSLAREYYSINDWISNAYGLLLLQTLWDAMSPPRRQAQIRAIKELETALLHQLELSAKDHEGKEIPLPALNIGRLLDLEERARGKSNGRPADWSRR
jgi:hypothetical protein